MAGDDDIVLGIDLGTTFSAMAFVNEHGKPEIVPNSEGFPTTPSIVHFYDEVTPGELYRIQGEILAAAEPAEGERLLRTALDLVRRSGSRSLELRAALGLGRLWKDQGRDREAHALVAGIYHDFTEGFATQDLGNARDFLDSRANTEAT